MAGGAAREPRLSACPRYCGAHITTRFRAAGRGKLTTTSESWRDQCTTLNHTGTEYRIRNRNTKAGPLFYNVKVYRKSTGAPVVLDPAIINDP